MNQNAQAWVKALRSGDYEQAQQFLQVMGEDGVVRYCCLGVACELFMEAVPGVVTRGKEEAGSYTWMGGGSIFAANTPRSTTLILPEPVRKWLGLNKENGKWKERWASGVTSLAGMNDAGSTFDEIADRIEEAPAGLFA